MYTYTFLDGSKQKVKLSKTHYHFGGGTLLKLVDEDDYLMAVATINISNAELTGKEIIVKDYSENKGMLDFLQKNNIVGPVKRYVPTGFVICPVVDLLKEDI